MTNKIHFSETCLSDLHKDAMGFRPRHYPEWWTKEELDTEMGKLIDILNDNEEQARLVSLRQQRKLEELLTKLQQDNGISRADALRWVWQGQEQDNCGGEVGYFLYDWDISYELEPMYTYEFQQAGCKAYCMRYRMINWLGQEAA